MGKTPAKRNPSKAAGRKTPTLAELIARDLACLPTTNVFDKLLPTWPLRFERWRHVATTKDLTPPQLEVQYGDGHYDDRRALLHTAVTFLQRHNETLLPIIFAILAQARESVSFGSLQRTKFLAQRERLIKPDDVLSRQAVKALKALRQHRRTWDPESDIVFLANALIAKLDGPTATLPKLPRGRAPSSVAPRARNELKKVGIPAGLKGFDQALTKAGCEAKARNLRETLLMAVGLIPYRKRSSCI